MNINLNNKILRRLLITFAVLICSFVFSVINVNATTAMGGSYSGCCCNSYLRTAVEYSTSNSNLSSTLSVRFGLYQTLRSGNFREYTNMNGYINGTCYYASGQALRYVATFDGYSWWSGYYSASFTRNCTSYTVPLRVWFFCSYVSYGQDPDDWGTHYRDDVVANATISAHSHYTISYNANTVDTNGDTLISTVSGVPSSQRKCIDSNITLSSDTPTCQYYKFKGWSTDKSATSGSYSPGATYTSNKSMTLYAIWEKVEFNVTLDQQGATKNGTTTAKATYNGAWSPNPITLPEKTGYTFHGFFSETDGNGTQYFDNKGYYTASWTTLGEGTIYAYWTPNDYNIRLYPRNPQTGENTAQDITVTYDSSYNNKVTIPTTIGYVCTGYYDDPTAGQQIFDSDGKWVESACWDSTGHWIKAKNMTLYAHWEIAPIENAVVFDNQGGTGGPEKMSVTYGQTSYIPTEVPTKKKSAFIYWSTNADGTGIKYYQNAPFPGEVTDEYYNNYIDDNGNVDPVVLYAIYDNALDPEDSIAEQNVIYNIYESNVKEGLLDAGIEYNYKNFFGQVKQILSRKSVILDNSSEVSEDDAVAVGSGKWKVGDPIPGLDNYLPEDSYTDENGNVYIKVDDDGIKRISTEEDLVKYIAEITAKNNETDEDGNFVNRDIAPYQIQLQNDIQLSSTLIIPEDLNVELDLDGHTLSGQGCDIIKTQGNLKVSNGSILGYKDKYIVIVDGGIINVESTAYLYSDSTGCTCFYVTSNSGTVNIDGASLNTSTTFKSDSATAYIISGDNTNIHCDQYFAEEYDKTTMGTVELKLGYYDQNPTKFIDTDHYAAKSITGDYKYQVVEDEKSLTTVKIEANTVNPGTVTGTGKYAYNSVAKLTATNSENTYFQKWLDSEGNEITADSDNVVEVLRSKDGGTLEVKAKENVLYTAVFVYYLWEVQVECEHGTASGAMIYQQGSKATITVDDIEEGYQFEKWVNAQTGAELSTDKTYEFIVKSDVEIKAVFSEKEYTLTYNANGGTNAPEAETMTISSENYITEEVPTYTNNSLVSWNTKQDGSGDDYKAGDLFKSEGELKKDTTLYAQWTESSVLLAFDANRGTGAPEAMTLKYSQMYRIPTETPTKDGVSFRFWNTKADGSGTSYNPGDIIKEANYLPASNMILYAQWTSKGNEILYYDQGAASFSGKHEDGYPEEYSSDSDTTLLSATKEGYIFNGWYTNSACTGSPITSIVAGAYSSDVMLYAKWTEITATLTYNANGGPNAPDSVTMRYSKPYSVSTTTPTRIGYVFAGWNTKANGTGTDYKIGKAIKAENVIPEDITLYAQWIETTGELAYDLQGGSGTINSVQMKYTTETRVTDVEPTLEGYDFIEWNTEADGNGESYAPNEVFKAANETISATTLYAQWSEKTATLTYNANEGSNAPAAATLRYTDYYKITEEIPTREGYTFTKWNTKADGSGTSYKADAVYKVEDVIPEDATLYAQWSEITALLTYDANDGNNAPDGVEMKYTTETIVSTDEPSRYNYDFVCWNTKSDGSGTDYLPGATINEMYQVPADTVLYAQWASTEQLIYDANGGINAPDAQDMTYKQETEITSGIPKLKGYVFSEWNTEADGSGTSYSAGDVFKKAKVKPVETTLYAQWTEAQEELAFDATGGTAGPTSVIMKYTENTYIPTTTPTKTGMVFTEWNSNSDGSGSSFQPGDLYKDANIEPSATTLYAQWTEQTATLSYSANSGTGAPGDVTMYYSQATTVSSTQPTRSGYVFNGWNSASDGSGLSYSAGDTVKAANSLCVETTLYAQWRKIITFTIDGTSYNALEGQTLSEWVSSSYNTGGFITTSRYESITNNTSNSRYKTYGYIEDSSGTTIEISDTFTNGETYTQDYCITGETLITLADGSTKQAQDLTGDEKVLTWNHDTGSFEATDIMCIVHKDSEESIHEVTTMEFSDGTKLEIINEHVFYDYTLNKYVSISKYDVENFYGHKFIKEDFSNNTYKKVTLVNATTEKKSCKAYEIITANELTCFTEGILTASAYNDPFLNIFDINKTTLSYDNKLQDVQKYGLCEYDQFKDQVDEATFNAFGFKYMNIALSKQNTTKDRLDYCISIYTRLGLSPQ